MSPTTPVQIVIVGAGPKGIGVLERLCASAPTLLGRRRVVVHLVDPYPPGAGRVWRYEQSPLLLMNSKAADVTVFTDETVQCEGPARPGPTLAEWAEQVRDGRLTADVPPDLATELAGATPATFHTRRMQSAYLRWFYRWVLDNRPDTVDVRLHPVEAVDLTEADGGEQLVWLRGEAEPLRADAVVLSLGHLDAEPGATGRELTEFAERHGRRYIPPAYTADLDLSSIEPGEPVLVRGFGLAFMDLMALLTEGRGGRFHTAADGAVTYQPSGAEPVLHVGSRRGVPYRPKPGYKLVGAPARLPRFFGPPEIGRLAARPGPISFWADLWPLMAKEIGWGYYTELCTAHPERVRLTFAEFARRYAELDWGSDGMARLVAEAVPARDDRLDLTALDRPLAGMPPGDAGEPAGRVREHVESVLSRCADPRYSADLGAVTAMLSVFRQLPAAVATGRLDPRAQAVDLDGWWFGFFSYLGSGPPAPRLRELLALERAGIVSFTGPDMWVEADEGSGLFVGGSPKSPRTVKATTLVDARLPGADVSRSTNPLVQALYGRGRLGEEALTQSGVTVCTGRIHTTGISGWLIDARGERHPRRFALGPHTTLRIAGAFSRPRANALGFRENDLVAREILQLVAG
ncbi:FAD/NAD(P)-binding protein [Amycolatopsis sp.]|uniref:FAD/NAD(P)-binding protein n=1 Tax=Amycolatopsis sp. TaxID=37632 RepID=UPI002BEA182A|nr:FAD/NAD(P)-binding protein [Amycolatopsis sp.]HVV11357.1 FAD/NAD(P)-binding protein [Amycolatopsis sp.]